MGSNKKVKDYASGTQTAKNSRPISSNRTRPGSELGVAPSGTTGSTVNLVPNVE